MTPADNTSFTAQLLLAPAASTPANDLTAWVDGSGHHGTGGLAVVIVKDDAVHLTFANSHRQTTNQRMEIAAAITALRIAAREKASHLTIYSDSQYVVYTMTRGWKRKKNTDLWAKLDAASAQIPTTWIWRRGHNGDEHNELADQLAGTARNLQHGPRERRWA